MKFNFDYAHENDVVQTSAEYGSYSGEKSVKLVQRAALTLVSGAVHALGGYNTKNNDTWAKKLKAEFESMTIHLINSVEGKRRTYGVADVMNAFQIGNALQIADSTLQGIKQYLKATLSYKINNVTAASQLIQSVDSNIAIIEGLLDSFPVSPYVKALVRITGYYAGNKNHCNTAFLIDEIGMWKTNNFSANNCNSFFLTIDVAQETDADRLTNQIDALVDNITGLINNTTREAAADLISYGKGSLKGIKCSGLGSGYDVMRKLICNSVGGYTEEGGFDDSKDGTYYYSQIGVKWASVIIGYSQDHASLRDAITSVVGEADGSGIDSNCLLGACFGYFDASESESHGTVEANIVSIFFAKWLKHLTDEGQIWVWTNDRIAFDSFTDWDEAATNLPLLITNITSGFRDGFNLHYTVSSTGRRACYFSTLADAEFVYYPVRLLDFAKDYVPNMVSATIHIDVEKLRTEKHNLSKPNNKDKDKAEKPKEQSGKENTAK